MTAVRPTLQAFNTGFAQGPGILRLHLNESPYGPVPGAVEAAAAALAADGAVYPDSDCIAVRDRIARHFEVDMRQVVVGNGVEELLLLTALTFLRRDDPVLVTETTFPGYLAATALAGGVVQQTPLHADGVATSGLASAIRAGARLAFVCNPHNPMGTVLDEPGVARIADAAGESDAVVAFDEAYIDFAGPEHEHALRAVRAGRRVLVMRSFSKAWGLAALRIGFALGPADLVERILHTRQAQPFGVNRLAQYAAAAAIDRADFIQEVRLRTAEARTLLCQRLEAMGIGYVPSVANFVLIRTGGDSSRVADRLAQEHQVLVRDLTGFGLPGRLRVSVGNPEQVDRLCAALSAVLADAAPATDRPAGPAATARAPAANPRTGPAGEGLGAKNPQLQVPTLAPADPASLFNGYTGSHVVFALAELGVWDRLAEHPSSPADLAEASGADLAKLVTLLRVAALLGYVELDAERVALTPVGGGIVRQLGFFVWGVGGYGALLRELPRLAAGEVSFGREIGRDEGRIAAGVGRAGRHLMRPVEERVLAGVDFTTVADVGCGDGSRMIRLCQPDSRRRGVGVEVSGPACDLAVRRIAEAGLADRLEVVRADALEFGAGHPVSGIDLVTCFFVLHDLFARGGPPATMRALREMFPDTRQFLVADTMAYDWPGHTGPPPIFTVEFELVHAFMDTPILGRRVYEEAFARAGLRIAASEPFGVPSTWLYHLTAQ